jgi:hypothetical protein
VNFDQLYVGGAFRIGHRLDVYGFGVVAGIFLVRFLFFFEFRCVPGLVAQRSVTDTARVDYYLFRNGFEADAAQICGRGLQSVKQQRGGFVVDLVGEQQTHALHERNLDGVSVLKHGQFDRGLCAAGAVGVELNAFQLPALVEVAEFLFLESR